MEVFEEKPSGKCYKQQQFGCSYHSLNHTEKNLMPTEIAFVIIVLLLISLSCAFSTYSLYHPRYMYKRVAGGLHLLTAAMLIVLIEMVESEGHR